MKLKLKFKFFAYLFTVFTVYLGVVVVFTETRSYKENTIRENAILEKNSYKNKLKFDYKKPNCTSAVVSSKTAEGFYCYVFNKGIPIEHLSENKYRILHGKWRCTINSSIAINFRKQYISWKDLFETDIKVLSNRTALSPDKLREKMGVLPKDGSPVTLVARQGHINIPDDHVIIRLNNHGPLDARTSMIMTRSRHIWSIALSARDQPNNEIIAWRNRETFKRRPARIRYNGQWNTSIPLVIPEDCWSEKNLEYYRGHLYFMKGVYTSGNLADCDPKDGIGLGAINRIAHLRGDITTVGFSTCLDKYNTATLGRFKLLAYKLAWSYFVVNELTDTF